ncbi:flavin-containing monooxygenase [Streptomyces alkaliterrae]|uniref:NAD(P)-binding protein n=1 Tax=Streptomyces alkaliterrae TaxID=2213162 RepID=A0A5P0YW35_9ACTN|nr:NAD(P)/FAD-dependent oxidoreductase [Streptomyces alkaliterrae]MBB1256018.1 NAD(P)/FAD-dependent oxidoreductase [Streptomyces alkaliterrae]MBB1261648.1 NAD(P)/FAD-dependent oxidoreductase [Streptomyces alkaliterrae]MQS04504.1 NAD(P)-binding protein [Streptomyces alkaliterrae]
MEPDHEVAVIGAGFSGIGTAIGLRRAGITDFVVLDEQDDAGGTWHANRYPGIAVDISAFSYSYDFEPSPSWSRAFPPGAELKAYADHCVDKYGVRPHLRLNSRVVRAVYDESAHMWRLDLADGVSLTARFVICATGWLTKPRPPRIEGIEEFAGDIVHTARWDPELELAGRRIGVIGTGASSVQVVPEIAPEAERLHVYQRTPIWLFPKPDFEVPRAVQRTFRRAPWTQRSVRLLTDTVTEVSFVIAMVQYRRFPFLVRSGELISRLYLRRQVGGDRELMAKLTPRYRLGCKRPSFAKGYWRTFTRPNVELVTEPIERITKTGIRTTDGREQDLDVLILATGFHVLENLPPFPTHGLGGRELKEFWRTERFQAYEGSSVKGFPNLWFIVGPYSFTGGSWFGCIDYQVTHALRVIGEARRRRATEAVVRPEKHDESFRKTLRRQRNTVFSDASCLGTNSYYFDARGDAPAVRPATTYEAAWRARRFDLDDYRYSRTPAQRPLVHRLENNRPGGPSAIR